MSKLVSRGPTLARTHRSNRGTDISDLILRRATIDDMQMIFGWRNIPEIVSLGKTQRPVDWDEHRTWFQEVVTGDNHLLLVVLLAGKPIGQVRFDRLKDHSCEVSVFLSPEFTGRGLGVLALKHACWEAFAKMDIEEVVATIRRGNRRSISAFKKAGFNFMKQPRINTRPRHLVLRARHPSDIPHNRITQGLLEVRAIAKTVRSGQWGSGPKVAELEATLAKAAEVRHVVCVGSGTAALRLTLKGLGTRPGDRVLVPAYSCVALASAVLACGASPVPVDVTPHDWNFDSSQAKSVIETTPPGRGGGRMATAIGVHTFGVPAAIEQMMDSGIPIIEDCAHGFGIHVNGKVLGGRAHASVLSFYATKLIGGGEGGAILTDSAELAEFARSWRDNNDQPPDGTRLNDKMNDLEATLALCQLQRLKDMLATRQRLAKRYDELLSPEANRTGPFLLPDVSETRVWYRYAVEMSQLPARDVVERLLRYGIHAAQPVTDWRPSSAPACPTADRAYRHIVSLPLYPTLSHEEQTRVAHAFLEVCREDA